jgi:hypothetical protein
MGPLRKFALIWIECPENLKDPLLLSSKLQKLLMLLLNSLVKKSMGKISQSKLRTKENSSHPVVIALKADSEEEPPVVPQQKFSLLEISIMTLLPSPFVKPSAKSKTFLMSVSCTDKMAKAEDLVTLNSILPKKLPKPLSITEQMYMADPLN